MVEIRNIQLADVPQMTKYWYESPPGFIESLGVDPKKMKTPDDFRAFMEDRCKAPENKRTGLVILFEGQPVGQHSVNPLVEGDYGIFHAHIWDDQFRRRGIGLKSYVLASKLFMDRFDLKRMLYKTPRQNIASIRVKEKLGMRFIGEEAIGFGIVKEGTIAKVYEATRDEITHLYQKLIREQC